MKNEIEAQKQIAMQMTQNDLRDLGLEEVGYVRQYTVKGKPAWVLHAADGTALAVQDTPVSLRLSAQHHELDIVSLH
jgi:hypothetical protein